MAASASADPAPRLVDVGAATLDVIDVGTGSPLIFLHGFPERAAGWLPIIRDLARDHRCIAPDQRGYGRSTRFGSDADYAIDRLVEDVVATLDVLAVDRATVVGHDWGGIVASAAAAIHPDRIERLALVNGPHIAALQDALLNDPAQRHASAYIERLRAPGAALALLANGSDGLWNRIFGSRTIEPAIKARYLAGWSAIDALDAMIAWYRAAPFGVPDQAGTDRPAWLSARDWWVDCPTLAVWGMRDEALPPALLKYMSRWCSDLRVERFSVRGHDIIHAAPSEVAYAIRRFLER